MTTLHSEVRVICGFSVRLALCAALLAAVLYGSRIWEAPELLRLEPYTVELNLLLPVLPLAHTLRMLQLVLGAALFAILVMRRVRKPG